jgi:hypothetical protein
MDSNIPELTDEELADCDALFTANAWEGKGQYEAEWRAQGQAVAWIDPKPHYINCCDWDHFGILREPEQACVRIMRFVLLGGGQIRVQEKFSAPGHRLMAHHDFMNCRECWASYEYGRRLLIQAETPDGLVKVSGRLKGFHYEMNMTAVVVPARYQTIADRVAKTFRAIGHPDGNPDGDNFVALLDGSAGCAFCGRALRDEVSKLIGIGPDCARINGLPHNMAAASAVLAKRRAILEA